MGKRSRNTGNRTELEVAKLLPGARKVSYAWRPGPDIIWRDRVVEVKYRKDGGGFALLYRWLADAQILAVRARRREWLIVMTVDELLDLLDERTA